MSRKKKHNKQSPQATEGHLCGAWRAAALLMLALALGLGMAEWLCRLSFKKNVEALKFTETDLYYYYDPSGFRRNIPNKVGYERLWNDAGKAEFRINSLGFRGPEMPVEKSSGAFRILFLGDSITLGGRLPEDVIFVERVHRALNALSPRYEVANAGVGDVGLVEEEDMLKTVGAKIHPDLVVLCWYLNDARPPVGFPEEVIYKNPAVRWFNRQAWLRKSYLAGFIYDALRKDLLRRQLAGEASRRFDWIAPYMAGKWARDPEAFVQLTRAARFDWGDAWNEASMRWMTAKIRGLRDFARARGMRFVVVAMPEHAQVYAGFRGPILDQPQRELASFAQDNGIPFLDLLPALRSRANQQRLFYDNCHYTPEGNAVVAGAILDFLKKSNALAL